MSASLATLPPWWFTVTTPHFLSGRMKCLSIAVLLLVAVDAVVRVLKEGAMDAIKLEGGGFRSQGKTVSSAVKVVETALALQEAGCFSVVLECVPPPVAAAATSALRIPTIVVGAGPFCSGQVLVCHDLLGMLQHPRHAQVTPRFCKQNARVGDVINKALSERVSKMGLDKAASAAAEAAEMMDKKESLAK
ncbi:hypothetical protein SLEP1_g56209 [Rubroshorea leprosula]|uniref:3-methyl-2-oxobutanoate hydroxymethyltransferase n=1 Tax=Rubroshorea leprosula TaxID=152421 RepID=A0AAV5MIV8_9ROSI|nr:hypothetical protein SLEP1_g56209 [Rubroshorea leprosula]